MTKALLKWLLLLVLMVAGTHVSAATDVPAGARVQGALQAPSFPQAVAPLPYPTAAAPAPGGSDYILGIADRVRLNVYGEEDLSGEYEVSSSGTVALPLVGSIRGAGLSLAQFEQAVAEKLRGNYLKDPRVSVQVTNYRPFFILGEVAKPGSYAYVNGMSVLNAVALAGGYTYRADKDDTKIVRANDASKKEMPIREDAVVQPGDIIRVPERLF